MPTEVISLITGFVGAIIGYLLSLLTLRFNYHQLFAETVSKNRMEWINVWRENISIFLACAEALHKCDEVKCLEADKCKYLFEMNKARAMITSRLNMSEELHVLMGAAVNNLKYELEDDKFIAQRDYILELARQILKPEWERVKREAKGKK